MAKLPLRILFRERRVEMLLVFAGAVVAARWRTAGAARSEDAVALQFEEIPPPVIQPLGL